MVSFTLATANSSYATTKSVQIQLQNPSYDARTGTALQLIVSGTHTYQLYQWTPNNYFQIQSSITQATYADVFDLEPFFNACISNNIIQQNDYI
jgi:hypothetical protein